MTIAPAKGLNNIHIPTATQWFENIIAKVLFHFFSCHGRSGLRSYLPKLLLSYPSLIVWLTRELLQAFGLYFYRWKHVNFGWWNIQKIWGTTKCTSLFWIPQHPNPRKWYSDLKHMGLLSNIESLIQY